MNLNLEAHELDPQVGNPEKESGASFAKADTLVETWAGLGKEKSPEAMMETAAKEIQITTTSVSHSEETTIRSESLFNITDKEDTAALNQPVIAVSEEYTIRTTTSGVTTGISSATAGSVFAMETLKSDTAALPETQEEDNEEGEEEGEGGEEGEGEGEGGEEAEAEAEAEEGGGGLVAPPVSDVPQDQLKAEMELRGEGLGEGDDTTPPFDDMVVLPDGMISAASLDEIAPLYSDGVRNTLDQSKQAEAEAAAAEKEAEKAEEEEEKEEEEEEEEPSGAAIEAPLAEIPLTEAPLAEPILAEDSAVQNDSDPQPQDLQGLMEEKNNNNNNNTLEAAQETNAIIATEDKQVNTGAIANGISEGSQERGEEAVKDDQMIESASIALPADEPVIEGEDSGLILENPEEAPVQSISNIASELGQEKLSIVKEGTADMEAPTSILEMEKPAIEGQTLGPVCNPEQAFAVQSLPEIASEVKQVGLEQTLTEEGIAIVTVDKVNATEQPEAEFEALIGRKVLKTFDGDDYAGEVIGYDADSKWYKVVYEDGDEEDLEKVELDVVLLPIGSVAVSTSKTKERKPKKAKKTSSETTHKSPAGSKKRSKSTPVKKKGSQSSVKKVKSPGVKGSKKSSSDSREPPKKKTPTPKKTNKRKRVSIDEETRTPKMHKGKKETSIVEQGKKSSSKKDAKKAPASKSVEDPTKGGGGLKRKGVSAGDEDMHRPSKRSKVDSGMEMSSDKEDASVIGSLIRKKFGGKYFTGEVVSYDKKRGYYKVQYEDGDKEDLEWIELEPILIDNQKKSSDPDTKASASGEKGKSLPVNPPKPKPKSKAKGKSKSAGKKGGSSKDKRKGRARKPAGQ